MDIGTPVQSFLTPGTSDQNTWGTHKAQYGIGGLEVVNDDDERNNISQERREGKIIYNKASKQFNTWNGTEWVLLDLTLQTNHNAAYLSYLKNDQTVRWEKDKVTAYLWFDLPVYENLSTIISLDKDRKTIVLEGGEYFISFRIYSESVGDKSGTVTISIIDSQNNNAVINDADGNPLSKSKSIDSSIKIGEMFVDGVIDVKSLTHLRLQVETDCGSLILKDRNSGASGFVIQEMRDGEQSGSAFIQWILDTGINPMITSYYFDKGFKQTDIESMGNIGNLSILKGFSFIQPSGEFFETESSCTLSDGDDKQSVKVSGSTGYKYGLFLDYDFTKLLRGKTIHAYGKALPHNTFGDHVLVVAYWDGNPDKENLNIVQSVTNQGVITYQTGWHEVNHMIFNELNITEEYYNKVPRSGYMICDIPQGANNLVAFFMPVANKPTDIDINYIRLDAVPSFTSHSIEHRRLNPFNSYVSQLIYSRVKVALQDPINANNHLSTTPKNIYDAVWFDSSNYSLYEGSIKRVSDLKGWQFNEVGDIGFNISFKGMTIKDDHVSNITFFAKRYDASGQNESIIQQSVKKLNLPRTSHSPHNCEVYFTTKVEIGEVIRFFVKSDEDNDCKIFYDKEDIVYKAPVLKVDVAYINTGKTFNEI